MNVLNKKLKQLMTKGNKLISTVYFNILSFIKYGATIDKNEKYIVVVDETHLLLKESYFRSSRGKSSCQWLATQDLKDFTANEINLIETVDNIEEEMDMEILEEDKKEVVLEI